MPADPFKGRITHVNAPMRTLHRFTKPGGHWAEIRERTNTTFRAIELRQIAPLCFLVLLTACYVPPFPGPTAPTVDTPPPPHPIAIDGELAHGDVVVGQSRVITVTFRNTGNRALILPPPGASFNFAGMLSMTPPPARLEPGEATGFNLRFTPTAIGLVSGSFGVTAQTVTGEDVPGRSMIAISGTGVALR